MDLMPETLMSPKRRPVNHMSTSNISPKRIRPAEPVDMKSSTAVLVYNVSLNDMLVVTSPLPAPSARLEFPSGLPGLARPLFNAQLPLAMGIAAALGQNPALVTWPETMEQDNMAGRRPTPSLPLGFEVPSGQGSLLSSADLRFRVEEDATKWTRSARSLGTAVTDDAEGQVPHAAELAEEIPNIVCVLFPLLATVVTAWLRGAASKADRKVVLLASSRAEPRDAGAKAHGNSTERTAQLMARFLSSAYIIGDQNIHAVEPLHGDGDAFRYDANLRFCHEMLLPLLDAERGEVASRSGDDWPQKFSVTLALCDGTHSRLQVLSQCLREYRPQMAHLSPLKAFWHCCALRPSTVDRESFERAFEAAPPSDVASLTDPALVAMIAEVVAHRNSFLFAQPRDETSGSHDLERFWLRKTRKPVLSVLLVQRDGGPLRMHRGINLEVSMPTGSLCSERNVIGTAFATDPSLRREDLRAIAVLAVDPAPVSASNSPAPQPSRGRNPLAPCGACMEWLRKIYEVNPSFRVLMFEDESCQHVFIKTVGRLG